MLGTIAARVTGWAFFPILKWGLIAAIPLGCFGTGWVMGREDLLEDALEEQAGQILDDSKVNVARAERAAGGLAKRDAEVRRLQKELEDAISKSPNDCECALSDDELRVLNGLIEESNGSGGVSGERP